jgi:acetyltransferase-like isoleucine patch superfamily enzyme
MIPPIANFDHRPYHQSHSSMYGPVHASSPRESVGTYSSHNPPFSHLGSSETSEKYKMLIGEPYRAYIDEDLLDDRRTCKTAVERWNEAHHHSRATIDDEKGRLFECILDPSKRTEPNYQYRDYTSPQTRPGSIGSRVIINNPFTCDYGYNIHIGDDTVIGANCTIEDPCDIIIGSRVQIGKNVTFCGNVLNDGTSRTGSQATMMGGAIIVEDEVNIGTGTTINAHRVIGRGASIGNGSVVTKVRFDFSSIFPQVLLTLPYQNIPPYTYAAGNPCRVIRSLPRPDSSERLKRHSRELTAFTNNSSAASSGGGEDDLVGDRQLALENEQSLREMRARRGIREQGR